MSVWYLPVSTRKYGIVVKQIQKYPENTNSFLDEMKNISYGGGGRGV